MKSFFQISLVLLTIYFLGCVEPYSPPNVDRFDDLLVVDGNVNGTTGEANVYLSRSQALNDLSETKHVSGAAIEVRVENGATYFLDEISPGRYYAKGLTLSFGDRVQLYVSDNDGSEYISDFEEYIETPKIDEVTYTSDKSNVTFYVSTHDPDNNTFYYKWDYTETWEFRSAYPSLYFYERQDTFVEVFFRERYDTLYYCYQYDSSTQIIIGNTKRLSEDVVSEFPIARIGTSTGKFAERYSFLVKQRALSESAYQYWELLQSNTESLGSIFDPQPSQLTSNIQNISSPEIGVLGYFNLYSEEQMRISLAYQDVTPHGFDAGYSSCVFDTVFVEDMFEELFPPKYLLSGLTDMGPIPYAYTTSFPTCVDCRLRGSNKVPEFWQ